MSLLPLLSLLSLVSLLSRLSRRSRLPRLSLGPRLSRLSRLFRLFWLSRSSRLSLKPWLSLLSRLSFVSVLRPSSFLFSLLVSLRSSPSVLFLRPPSLLSCLGPPPPRLFLLRLFRGRVLSFSMTHFLSEIFVVAAVVSISLVSFVTLPNLH